MEHDERLNKFFDILDRAYKLEGSVPCGSEPHKCRTGCEPGLSDTTIVLLPNELEYISKRLGEPAKFETTTLEDGRVIGFQHDRCPYLSQDSMCTIYESRPIDCRSYPFVPTMIEDESLKTGLKYLMDTKCPLDKKLAVMREHTKIWIAVWRELLPFLNESWWDKYDSTDPVPEVLSVLKKLYEEEVKFSERDVLFQLPVLTNP